MHVNFILAEKRHAHIRTMLAEATPEERAHGRTVWNVLAGIEPDPPAGSIGESILDTMPMEVATTIATKETAAVVAWRLLAPPSSGLSGVALRDTLREYWKLFQQRAEEAESLALGFGWDESEAWEIMVSAPAFHPPQNVARIAALAGRMYASLKGEVAQSIAGHTGEIYSVEQGDDLARMLPVERLSLSDPMLELALFDRIETRRMLQYAVRDTSRAAKGPLVVALDESGSMHGHRNEWSKAAALAVARVAAEHKRPIVIVHFSSSVVPRRIDPAKAADVMAMLGSFLNGGTYIGHALTCAADEIRKLESTGKGAADVILITDGVAEDPREVEAGIDALQALKARLFTVAIDLDIQGPLRDRAAAYERVNGAEVQGGGRPHALMSAA